jgi:6-phosphogluconate dehydrogenase
MKAVKICSKNGHVGLRVPRRRGLQPIGRTSVPRSFDIEARIMPVEPLRFGVVGLGKMGGGIARHAITKGFHVVGLDKAKSANAQTVGDLHVVSSVDGLAEALAPPRTVFLYLPAGPVVDDMIGQLAAVFAEGDIIADGGNSYWGDSIRRHSRLKQSGIEFVDVGTSGGPTGALEGACFMVGGEPGAVAKLEPLLKPLAVAGGYVHAGGPGAGHYVKLVHNGIEFGMLQAIAEGVDLLERYQEKLPTPEILACWRHGSVIRSWLIELMEAMYRDKGSLAHVPDYIEDTGEVNWLVEDAIRMDVPIPVITQSVLQLIASRDKAHNWARAVAMMRHGFGGHPYGADAHIAEERTTGRTGRLGP